MRGAHRAWATAFLAWLGRFTATRSFDSPVDPPACDHSGRRAQWLDQGGGIGAAVVGGASASRQALSGPLEMLRVDVVEP